MKMRMTIVFCLLFCSLAGMSAATAGPWDHRYPGGRFGPRDWGVWRGGGWRHAWYGGRFGWWWVVGGAWYFYPAPAYPYPDPYTPYSYGASAPAPAPTVVAPQPQYWYWCAASKAYYPYVATCPSGWQTVPATPSPQAPAPGG